MPFGKYKGMSVWDVPPDYALWFLRNVSSQDELKGALRHCLLHPEERMPSDRKELEAIVRRVVSKMCEESL